MFRHIPDQFLSETFYREFSRIQAICKFYARMLQVSGNFATFVIATTKVTRENGVQPCLAVAFANSSDFNEKCGNISTSLYNSAMDFNLHMVR